MLQKRDGPTVMRHTTAPGQENITSHRNSSSTRPIRKWVRVLAAFVRGERLHRFAAEQRLSDHTLPSTVSELQKKGVKIDRRDHTVPGYRGEPAHVALYWLNTEPENVSRARALLAAEGGSYIMNAAVDTIALWRRAICSPAGPESPMTRYVLLALAARMERDGCCARSESQLAEDTGLVKRSVITHLQLALEDGWIVRCRRRPKGRLHPSYVYEARLPARFDGNARGDEVQEMHQPPIAVAS